MAMKYGMGKSMAIFETTICCISLEIWNWNELDIIGHWTLLKKSCLSLQEFSRKVPTNQSGHRSGR